MPYCFNMFYQQLWVYFVRVVSLLPQKQNRLFSRATNKKCDSFLAWSFKLTVVLNASGNCHNKTLSASHRRGRQNMSFSLAKNLQSSCLTTTRVKYYHFVSEWTSNCNAFAAGISSSVLWDAIMCVRVSMGSEVCQIWPSSSAPAAPADCRCLRLREASFMTQG